VRRRGRLVAGATALVPALIPERQPCHPPSSLPHSYNLERLGRIQPFGATPVSVMPYLVRQEVPRTAR
jgi:hypothetical protein